MQLSGLLKLGARSCMSTSSATPCKMIVISDDDAKVQAPINSSTTTALAQKLKEPLFTRFRGCVQAAPMMLCIRGMPSSPQFRFSRQTVGVGILHEKWDQVWVL